jgi:hypothetical protein
MAIMIVAPVAPPHRALDGELTIEATGERNISSSGSEVWIEFVRLDDGRILTLSDFQEHEGWEEREGALLSDRQQPTRLTWTGPVSGNVLVRLKKHDWAGVVTLTWNRNRQTIDLYYPTPTAREVHLGTEPSWRDYSLRDWLSVLAAWVAIGGLLAWPVVRVLAVSAPPTAVGKWDWAWFALPSTFAWCLYLLTFWPGLMTSDSISQWETLVTGRFDDWIPILHTLLYWSVTRLWMSPAAISLVQILLVSASIGLCLHWLGQMGAQRWSLWFTSIAAAVSPAMGTMVVTLWKDVLFGAATLIFCLVIAQIVWSDGTWMNSRRNILILALAGALTALLRHNGVPVVLATLAILILFTSGVRRQVMWSSAICLALIAVVRGPIVSSLTTGQSQPGWLWPPIHVIAAQTAAGTEPTSSELAVMQQLRPGYHWPYDCTVIDPTLFDGQLNLSAAQAEAVPVAETAFAMTLRNPVRTLDHFTCSTAYLWRATLPAPPEDFYYTGDVLFGPAGKTLAPPYDRAPGAIQTATTSISPWIGEWVGSWVLWSKQPDKIWLFWRPATYLLVICAATFVWGRRIRRKQALLFLTPILVNTAALAVFSPGQDFRLGFGTFITALVTTMPFLWSAPRAEALN